MLTLFHDFTSPASAVAVARLQRLADKGVAVAFRGMEVAGIDMVLPVTGDVLAELEAVEGEAAAEGLALRRPRALPPTGLAHVVADLAAACGCDRAWRTAAYRAFWEHGADLGDRGVLAGLGVGAGLERDRVSATLDDRLALAAVRRRTAALRGEGVGGVPTILAHRTLVPGLIAERDLRAMAIG